MPDETPTTTEETTTAEPTTTSRVEEILAVILGRLSDLPRPSSRVEQLLIDLKAAIDAGGTADRELADAIDKLKARMTAVELTDTVQNVAIAEKANTSDVTDALTLKANSSDVTDALALKANSSDMTTALAAKADASTVSDLTTTVSGKANTSDVNTALATKFNSSDIVICTEDEWKNMSSRTALLYHIID